MSQDFFEWDATHKIFLAANHKPKIMIRSRVRQNADAGTFFRRNDPGS